jgi:general secretion pathway protein G
MDINANRARYMARAGFTLIELLLVMVILAVLAAVVVPKFTNRGEQAKEAAAKADIAAMELALDMFEVDNGRYPATEEGIPALVTPPPAVSATWKGPYLKKGVPADPWGNPYQYKYPGQHNAQGYDLYSLGPENREGVNNIDNWTIGSNTNAK